MPRIVRVGAGGGEISWQAALKDLRGDDLLMLAPGFYELPQGIMLTDVTIKGTGGMPEDTTIIGYIEVSPDSRFVTLENLCLNPCSDHNALSIPEKADTYLSLRNCVIKGNHSDTAAIGANGKVTLELYGTQIKGGSVSMFAQSDFRIEMADSEIDYLSDQYCALALDGKGTAIINHSQIHGSVNTFESSNCELDFNHSEAELMLLHGQTWLNMLDSCLRVKDDAAMQGSDDCYLNIVNCHFDGGIYLEKRVRAIIQNSYLDRLITVNEVRLHLVATVINSHADFQDQVSCDATRVTFNGQSDFQYFLALSGKAQLAGHDLILNANGSGLTVQDDASFKTNVLASDQARMEVECQKAPNVHILGVKWDAKKLS